MNKHQNSPPLGHVHESRRQSTSRNNCLLANNHSVKASSRESSIRKDISKIVDAVAQFIAAGAELFKPRVRCSVSLKATETKLEVLFNLEL